MGLADIFKQMMEAKDKPTARRVAMTTGTWGMVSTMDVSDFPEKFKPFETAVLHEGYDAGRPAGVPQLLVVATYATAEEALAGHDRLVKAFTVELPDEVPSVPTFKEETLLASMDKAFGSPRLALRKKPGYTFTANPGDTVTEYYGVKDEKVTPATVVAATRGQLERLMGPERKALTAVLSSPAKSWDVDAVTTEEVLKEFGKAFPDWEFFGEKNPGEIVLFARRKEGNNKEAKGKAKAPGAGLGFFPLDPAGGRPRFAVVNLDYWAKNGKVEKRYLGDEINFLDANFDEVAPSVIAPVSRTRYMDKQSAYELLVNSGLAPIDRGLDIY